jgi:hypothetical protein
MAASYYPYSAAVVTINAHDKALVPNGLNGTYG